jgi:hypothetical protein
VSRDDASRWRWNCDKRGCYLEDRWSLTTLDGALPHGAQFGDLDGWAEIDGRFLFIEHKPEGFSWDTANGQWRALKQLSRLPGVTVWWIRDSGDDYEIAEPGRALSKVTLDELRARVRAWADDQDPWSEVA